MNFWRQTNHIMSFFKEENFRGEKRLPSNFVSGFLEVSAELVSSHNGSTHTPSPGSQLECGTVPSCLDVYVKAIKKPQKKKNSTSLAQPVPECPLYA